MKGIEEDHREELEKIIQKKGKRTMKKGQKRTIEKNWKGLFERKENGGKIPLPQKTK